MIRYLPHDEIDPQKWDECISRSVNGNLCSFSWYLDLVCPGWCALVEGDYHRVMPLPAWKKAGIGYLSQPFFTQQLGVFSPSPTTEEMVNQFLETIPKTYRFIDINLNAHNKPGAGNFNVMNQLNHELDLIETYEQLQGRYATNLKRNLKKAASSSLSLVKNSRPEEIISLFKMNKGKYIPLLGAKEYALLLRVVYLLVHMGKCEVWGVFDNKNELVAGAFWGFSNQKAIFMFSATSAEGREASALPWLIDRFIQEHASSAITLDFEGSNDENLARFYAGFGSKVVEYPRISRNNLPGAIMTMVSIIRSARVLLKK